MKKIIIFILLFLIPFGVNAREDKIKVNFSKCIDGDTAQFLYGEELIKARFLAVDTPETKHPTKGEEPFGKEASNYTCKAITNAKKIELEFDGGSDEFDKYNRYLVWVFVDDSLLQKELIEKGYASVAYLYGDYKYTEELQSTQKIAQKNQVGIWGDYVDYTWYYIGGSFLLLVILFFIIKNTKNKDIKKMANKTNTKVKKEFLKYLKKL